MADPVLQLHFLNAMSFLVTADGPCYLSSIQGKDTFAKSKVGRYHISYSDSQTQLQMKRTDQSIRGVQVGAAESLDSYVPWLLSGVASACRSDRTSHDSGSQEVLAVRRRWIQFMDTAMKHIGVSFPVATEGLLLILCELLKKSATELSTEFSPGDSEFSRVDETLVLLEGLIVVSSNVLWSFEHALARGELRDDSQANSVDHTLEPSARSLPVLLPKESNSAISSLERRTSNSGTKINHPAHSVSEAVPVQSGSGFIDKANSVSHATSAVIDVLNPLRIINDFVKDVLIGGGSDSTHRVLGPRRSGARVLFCLLPTIVSSAALVWGPSTEVHIENDNFGDSSTDRLAPPRLSTELPRERRQAQRASVDALLEPLFELRPVQLVKLT